MEKYALVRLDVLRAWHVDEIAANPEAFIKRKLVNCWNNGHRAEKAKAKTAQKGAEVAGAKRAASVVDEQGEGHQAPPGKGKGKKARKSLAGAATDGEAKSDGKTGIKHSRSALTPHSDDKESTPSKRPANLKASSADDVKANSGEFVDDGEEE